IDPKALAESTDNGSFLVELYSFDNLRHRRVQGMLTDLKTIMEDHDIQIASIDCYKHKKFCDERNISSYPSLGFFHKSATKYRTYDRSINRLSLLRLVDLPFTEITKMRRAAGEVTPLHSEDFKLVVSNGTFFVKFFSLNCPYCYALAPIWIQLAEDLRNEPVVSLAEYNCQVDRSICSDFSIEGVPTLLWLENGRNIRKYKGNRKLQSLKHFALEMIAYNGTYASSGTLLSANAVSAGEVTALHPEDFKSIVSKGTFFIKFFLVSCFHCRALAPIWIQLAEELRNEPVVSVAEFNCQEDMPRCSEFDIRTVPTLLWLENGENIRMFNGEPTLELLKEFALEMIAYNGT
ncbi:hypothetical protein KR093_008101, partial [Drosophila rubida]